MPPFDINVAAAKLADLPKFVPIIKGWNRLEGRPRSVDFERALRAEVRDALWFLTRQWQFGEFLGEDAGSPVDARTLLRATPLAHYAAGGQAALAYDRTVPLETRVEGEAVPRDLPFHVSVSRYFFGLLRGKPGLDLAATILLYLAAYPLAEDSLAGYVDDAARATLPLAARKTLDCGKLMDEIASGAHDTRVNGFSGLSAAQRSDLKQAASDLAGWFRRFYAQPAAAAEDAWAPRFLEYQFACAAESPGRPQTVLTADDYTSGHLDWYSFDVDDRPEARLVRAGGAPADLPAAEEDPLSFLPAPVSFGGMPSPRYWEMEDRKIEFADIDANTTDVAKLLLTEFALVFGNDWCVFPYEIGVGSVCELLALIVTDDFGERTLVRAAGRGADAQWQRWTIFTMTAHGDGTSAPEDPRFFLPPALTKVLEGEPVEKTHFLRDEMANMVWGVEKIVPSAAGGGEDGYAVAREAAPALPDAPLHPTPAPVRYVLGTEVPANWIPFLPVHVPGSNRSVQLQRGRMPGALRAPRGRILSVPAPYYVNEEEVPRSGKIVTRSWQRARWLDGSTFLWLGRRVNSGKGEGSSGLAFDQVVDLK